MLTFYVVVWPIIQTQRFDIGYFGPINLGQTRNLLSAHNNPVAIKESLHKRIAAGSYIGPL